MFWRLLSSFCRLIHYLFSMSSSVHSKPGVSMNITGTLVPRNFSLEISICLVYGRISLPIYASKGSMFSMFLRKADFPCCDLPNKTIFGVKSSFISFIDVLCIF